MSLISEEQKINRLVIAIGQLIDIYFISNCRTVMEADTDNDHLISFEEFTKVMERTDVEQKMSIRFLD